MGLDRTVTTTTTKLQFLYSASLCRSSFLKTSDFLDWLWLIEAPVHTTHQTKTATNSVKIHSLARKNEHLRINQIQLRFLHFNQHSITLLGIHMRHSLRKVSTSLHPPPKLPCRNLAITELSVGAIVQPLGVVDCISVLNKTWNTCIYASEAVSTKALSWLQSR